MQRVLAIALIAGLSGVAVAAGLAGSTPRTQRVAQETAQETALDQRILSGAVLAERGNWDRGIPPCRDCHGPAGQGMGTSFPALAGKTAPHLKAQIADWKSGSRKPGPQGIMKAIAARLTPAEIDAVATFYAQAPQTPAPRDARIPEGAFGDVIRRGAAIFNETPKEAGAYLGNKLSCVHCHLDAGRLANSAPMGAAYVKYPMYRAKEGRTLTYAERLQGCFRYSMNGTSPPLGGDVLVALESYSFFLAKGTPVGALVPGQGYPTPAKPALGMDFQRGAALYTERCALCHGRDGQGQQADGQVVFPPLWGPGSFNWGAGMGRIDRAAGFIKANMPYSQGNSLSDQEAWDVAFFVDGHERPQDPRFTGNVAETRTRFHDTPMSNYGKTVDGVLLGAHSPPSGPQRRAAR